jgi:3-dehydroquinate synthase
MRALSSLSSSPSAPVVLAITSSVGNYGVTIDAGQYQSLLKDVPANSVFICDARFATELDKAGGRVIPLQADETVKSLDRISDVIIALRRHNVTRGTHLIAVGGGIVQDVAAFVAAIYMRGLSWSYYPTTLLGMADSCIGGKSSINVGEYKNIVGTYTPPQEVRIDPLLAGTLSVEQRVAGMVEAAKICFCRSTEAFAEYRSFWPSLQMNEASLAGLIASSLTAKKWFIEMDEFDKKERLLLNFGHTFGHAVEGASHYAVSHGVAVGVGMLMALELGVAMGLDYNRHEPMQFLRQHITDMLAQVPGLQEELAQLRVDDLFDRFRADKKHKPDSYTVVMVDAEGRTVLQALPRNVETVSLLKKAMDKGLNILQ